MNYCDVCFRILSDLPVVVVTEEDLQKVAPTFVLNKDTFLNHLLQALSKYKRREASHVHFVRPGLTPVCVCDYCIYCCSLDQTFCEGLVTATPSFIDVLASGSGSVTIPEKSKRFGLSASGNETLSDTVKRFGLSASGNETLSDTVKRFGLSASKCDTFKTFEMELDLSSPKLDLPSPEYNQGEIEAHLHPIGSFNRKLWQIHLWLNGSEAQMWDIFLAQKKFYRDLDKILDPRCYKSAIISPKEAHAIAIERGKKKAHYVNKIIKKSALRASAHAHSTLLLQDFKHICTVMHNVYVEYLIQEFDNNKNMGLTPILLLKTLTQLHYTHYSFPAWRVAFFVLWKHTETLAAKKKMAKLLLRRVSYNNYTKVIYRYISKEVNLLSLYNHNKTINDDLHLQIYKYNYDTIRAVIDYGGLPFVREKAETRPMFRSPRNYSPTFKQVCAEVQPVFNPYPN